MDDGQLERDLAAAVDGEVRFDAGTRAAYSTDASNFRQSPSASCCPARWRRPWRRSACRSALLRPGLLRVDAKVTRQPPEPSAGESGGLVKVLEKAQVHSLPPVRAASVPGRCVAKPPWRPRQSAGREAVAPEVARA
jgi:hypothetical protein